MYKTLYGHLRKFIFFVITASAPCSIPHVLHIHSGSVRGASLLAQKKSYFRRHPYLIMTLCCLFSICTSAEEMNLEAQLEEANMIIEEEKQKHQDMNEKLKALEAEIEQLRMRAKELDEEIGE